MIYAHIPFCESKCPYCSFNSFALALADFGAYFRALIAQFHRDRADWLAAGREDFGTLYIGGGTPSIVGAGYYEPFFAAVSPFLERGAEITIEANPNSLTIEWARAMRGFGVNRLSIGVQSFDDRKLAVLGRAHSGAQAKAALRNAAAAGFEQICVDLIYGVLGDDFGLLTRDLAAARENGANHISAYSLTIEEGAAIDKNLSVEDCDLERAFSEAIAAEFPRYEVSNYGKRRSRHNLGYWRGDDYLGLGAGAVGTISVGVGGVGGVGGAELGGVIGGRVRYEPPKSIAKYLENPLARSTIAIGKAEYDSERLMLGLRFDEGFSRSILNAKQQKRADILIQEGKLTTNSDRLFNCDLWLADEIWLFLNG
ncbi:coproporphyrinogen III oxidase [Campylobacterota bacterium]|nr:coproporphyrinogen III oxidase [Campylobacterota bacterium]